MWVNFDTRKYDKCEEKKQWIYHRYRGEIPKLAAIFSRHGEQFRGIQFYSESACVNCIFLRYERVFNRARKAATSATHIKVIARVICIAHSPHLFSAKSWIPPNCSPCREKNLCGRYWNFGISVSISVGFTQLHWSQNLLFVYFPPLALICRSSECHQISKSSLLIIQNIGANNLICQSSEAMKPSTTKTKEHISIFLAANFVEFPTSLMLLYIHLYAMRTGGIWSIFFQMFTCILGAVKIFLNVKSGCISLSQSKRSIHLRGGKRTKNYKW